MEAFQVFDFGSGIDIDGLIGEFNGIQSSIELSRCNLPIIEPTTTPLESDDFFAAVNDVRTDRSLRVIGVTAMPFRDNFFSHINRTYDIAIISTDQSELYTPKFSVEDYLKEELLSFVLLMLARMNIGHFDTRGCLFDFCESKRDIAIKLHTGSICADCRARLVYYGINDDILVASQRILWHISKDFHSAKVSRGCPLGYPVCKEYQSIQYDFLDANIFFATSFRDDYLDLADHLRSRLREKGYNLKVVNEDITNRNILCKICKTMQTCRFGIAEFSEFKHNVTYEFGLMQAFGLQTIAVMRDDRFTDFEQDVSDLKGIEVIPYKKVAGDLFDRIVAFVEAE